MSDDKLSDNKGVGKLVVVSGIVLLLVGIGVAVYVGMFSSPIASAAYNIPGWFANEIATAFVVLGFALIIFGAREIGVKFFGNM